MLVITWNFRNKVQKSGFMWPLLPGYVRGQLRASFNVSEQKFVFLLLALGAAAVRNIPVPGIRILSDPPSRQEEATRQAKMLLAFSHFLPKLDKKF